MKNAILCLAVICLGTMGLNAQQWNEFGNNTITPVNKFLGTTDNTPIPFRTANVDRMRLYQNTSQTIVGGGAGNTYTVNQAGFLGIGPSFNFLTGLSAKGPYSLIHLNGINTFGPQQTGSRSWMKYGVTFTHNDDFMYVGPRSIDEQADYTRAVIAWADNSGGGNGNDDFSFLFSDGGSGTPADFECREIMRLAGTGNVGIGNFQSNGLNQQPTHRLDVDGKVRIREVDPLALPASQSRDCILVGDFLSGGDYEVQRILFTADPDEYLGGDGIWHPIIGSGADCDWDTDANGITTGQPSTCNNGNVGVGVASSSYIEVDVRGLPTGTATGGMGIRSWVISPGSANSNATNRTAFQGEARNGRLAIGGDFKSNSYSGQPNTTSIGVLSSGSNAKKVFGVYSTASGAADYAIGIYAATSSTATVDHSGYFVGGTFTSGPAISISDESLKMEVSNLTDALEKINLLQPRTYLFNVEEYPHHGLDDDFQFGFLAQEVESVLPSLVKETMFISPTDTAGVPFFEDHSVKGLVYQEFIPILTQGIKEQQTQIESLNDRISDLEALVADLGVRSSSNSDSNSESLRPDYELYQNRPNPFSTSTEIVWRMAELAQARIIVQDAQGRSVAVLQDGSSSQGMHSVIWNAEGLPAGTYFYSLEVEGQLMIKRAVKLER